MNKNFDKQLQELLRNHTEQPSLDCWDRLSSRLDAMQGVNAGSAAGNTSAFSQFAGSVVGKIAITAIVATGIAAAVYFAIDNQQDNLQTAQQQAPAITETALNLSETETPPISETARENGTGTNISVSDKILQTENSDIVTVKENRTEEIPNAIPPAINTVANSADLSSADRETASQPKETAQQPSVPPIQKETATQSAKEKETVAENKEEHNTEETSKQPKLGIPNIITPNGDGINDCFVIKNLEIVTATQLYIYAKDGKVVYSKSAYDNKWDGRGLPDGLYYYIFQFTHEGEQFMRKGSITIRRD